MSGIWIWAQANPAAALALVGSTLAFAFTVWQGLFTRLNARITALPLLHSHANIVGRPAATAEGRQYVDANVRAQIINGGLGPAVVTKYSTYVDGVLIDPLNVAQTNGVLAETFGLNAHECVTAWFSLPGASAVVVPKDGTLDGLAVQFKVPTRADFDRVVSGLKKLNLVIEYKSLYGDEFFFRGDEPALPPKLGLFRLRKRKRQ
jgi:hypothetical protein